MLPIVLDPAFKPAFASYIISNIQISWIRAPEPTEPRIEFCNPLYLQMPHMPIVTALAIHD